MPKQNDNKNVGANKYTKGLDPTVTQTGIGQAENEAQKNIKNKQKS